MYHIDDLPFETSSLPDVYTQFRKAWIHLSSSFYFDSNKWERFSLLAVLLMMLKLAVYWSEMLSSWLHQNSSISGANTQHWGLGMRSFIRSVRTSISKCRCDPVYIKMGMHRSSLWRNLSSLHTKSSHENDNLFSLLFPLDLMQVSLGMKFVGGENAALGRINEYFWNKARYIYNLLMFPKLRDSVFSKEYW